MLQSISEAPKLEVDFERSSLRITTRYCGAFEGGIPSSIEREGRSFHALYAKFPRGSDFEPGFGDGDGGVHEGEDVGGASDEGVTEEDLGGRGE